MHRPFCRLGNCLPVQSIDLAAYQKKLATLQCMGILSLQTNLKSKWCRYTLMLSILQNVIMSVTEGYIAYQFANHMNTFSLSPSEMKSINALRVYHVLFITAQTFQTLFVLDAVAFQNTISLIAVIIFNVSSFVYGVIQQNQFTALQPLDAGSEWFASQKVTYSFVFGLAGIFTVLSSICCWKMHKELGWKIYKALGADVALKTMYRWYHFFQLLLKVDIFFYLGFSVQFILLVLVDENSTDTGILSYQGKVQIALHIVVGIITVVGLFVIGSYSAKKENRRLLNVFFIGTIGTIGYFAWKLSQIMDKTQSTRFQGVQKSLTVFTCACIALAMSSLAVGGFVKQNFGHGLRLYLSGKTKNSLDRWNVE